MVTAELPLEAAEALAAFLQLNGEEQGEEQGEVQGEEEEKGEVVKAADGPDSPTSPLETKLSTTEQTETDRRSSLAQ